MLRLRKASWWFLRSACMWLCLLAFISTTANTQWPGALGGVVMSFLIPLCLMPPIE
jgi:hypothetical protein